jgi:protein TonB
VNAITSSRDIRATLVVALAGSLAIHVGAIGLLAPVATIAENMRAMMQKEPLLLAAVLVQSTPADHSANETTPATKATVPMSPRDERPARAPANRTLRAMSAPVQAITIPADRPLTPRDAPERADAAPFIDPPPAAAGEGRGEEARARRSDDAVSSRAPLSSPVAYAVNPPPPYPEFARREGRQGLAVLDVLVAPDGAPTEVRIATTSGSAELDDAAIKAVARWRFVPATQDGARIDARIRIPIRFRLSDDAR